MTLDKSPRHEPNPLLTPIYIDIRDVSSRTGDYIINGDLPEAMQTAFLLWIPDLLRPTVSAVVASRDINVTPTETYGTLIQKYERTQPIQDRLAKYLQQAMRHMGIMVHQPSLPINSVLRIVEDSDSHRRQGQLVSSADYQPDNDVIYFNPRYRPHD